MTGTARSRREEGGTPSDGTAKPDPLGWPNMSKAAPASPLPQIIDELWEHRAELSPADEQARAAVVDERAKRAILLAFRVLPMARSQVGDSSARCSQSSSMIWGKGDAGAAL